MATKASDFRFQLWASASTPPPQFAFRSYIGDTQPANLYEIISEALVIQTLDYEDTVYTDYPLFSSDSIVEYLIKNTAHSSGWVGIFLINVDDNGFFCWADADNLHIRRRSLVGTTDPAIDSFTPNTPYIIAHTVDITQPYWLRFTRSGTNLVATIWQDGDAEPGTPTLSTTYSLTAYDGPYDGGFFTKGFNTLDFISSGIATAAAPSTAPATVYAQIANLGLEWNLPSLAVGQSEATLDADLPNLEALIHQGVLFSAELPIPDADFRAIAGPIATLDALLPSIEAVLQTAHKLNATLPALQAALHAETDQPLSLDAELPALDAQFELWVDISPTLDAELPVLEAQLQTAHKLFATLPALQAALSLPVSGVISLSAALPSLYFDASVVTSGTATLDATLPALEARSILLELVAELPVLTARISSSTLVETLTKTAYALNTETGALTDFANFQFLKLGTLNGKLYGLTSAGRLVRLEGDTDDGEPILGYLLTHSDDRIYNDIGELVRTDYLRRCYGVYLKSRNLQGVQVELINDELEKIAYPVMPQMRTGLANYRVDTYRGIMSHYWALGLRTQGGRFDLFSAALILESLDRKVW